MKRVLTSTLLLAGLAFSQSTKATITLYKDGFGLVKQPVSFNVKAGRSSVIYSSLPDRIESQSPFLSLNGAEILYQKYNRDVFETFGFLKDHLGEEVTVETATGRGFTGTLLDLDGKWIAVSKRGSVNIFNLNEVVNISASERVGATSVRPELSWDIVSDKKGRIEGELIYTARGFDWDADYRLVISPDEEAGILISQAIIKNETNLSYSAAKLELVEGELQRLTKVTGPLRRQAPGSATIQTLAAEEEVVFDRETLGDYHFYSLSEVLSMPKKESITVSLYPEKQIKFTRLYRFENQERSLKEEPLVVQISFKNEEKNALGVPMPSGKFQIYYLTGDGTAKFAGEDFLRQVPVDEEAEVIAGRAFDVLGRRTVVNYNRLKKSEEATILLEIKNGRDNPVSVQLTERIYGDWVIRDPSHDYTRTDAETAQFGFSIPAQSTETVTYTYRKEWQ